jgi:hypothetical protein
MSLPANDAFSYSLLAHDSSHPHRHGPVLRRRSTSSTLSSLTAKPSSSSSLDGVKGKGKGKYNRRRRKRSAEEVVVEGMLVNGSLSGRDDVGMGNGAVAVGNGVVSDKGKGVKVVDWEIPRKSLHSSVGAYYYP